MSERKILPGLTGRQPSKIKPGDAPQKYFFGDALSERNTDPFQWFTIAPLRRESVKRSSSKNVAKACPLAG